MKPREATTEKKILKLKRDNYPASSNKWSILVVEGYVILGDYVQIPRSQFNAIIDWYNKDQKP